MKKYLYYIVATIFILLAIASFIQRYIGREEVALQAESQALAEEVREVYDLIYHRKVLQSEAFASAGDDLTKLQEAGKKVHALDLQVDEKLKSVFESIRKTPSELVRIGILPKFAELLYVTGNRLEAQGCMDTGLIALEKVKTPEIQVNLYISYAESGLRCRDFTVYEQCLTIAENLIKELKDSKFRDEKEKTLADLKQLAEECRNVPERVFLPVWESVEEGENIPEEELPLEVSESHAGAPNQELPEISSEEIELEAGMTGAVSLEYLEPENSK